VGRLPGRGGGHGGVGGGQRPSGVAGGQGRVAGELEGGHVEVGQPVPGVLHPAAVAAGQERAPQPVGGAGGQPVGGAGVAGGQRPAGPVEPPLGRLDVDHEIDALGHGQRVAPAGQDHHAVIGQPGGDRLGQRGRQCPAGPADVGAQRGCPGAGRVVGPHQVGQAVAGQAGGPFEDQRGQHRPGRAPDRCARLIAVDIGPAGATDGHVTDERDLDAHLGEVCHLRKRRGHGKARQSPTPFALRLRPLRQGGTQKERPVPLARGG
jgi:hypothetical protein